MRVRKGIRFDSYAPRCVDSEVFGDRLAVGRWPLTSATGVQIPLPDPCLVMRLVSQSDCLSDERVSITLRGAIPGGVAAGLKAGCTPARGK